MTGGATLGVVTGLANESACLSQDANGVRVACAGANTLRARACAEDLADAGCAALVSFGLAGGLDPALCSGTPVVPASVLTSDGCRYPTDSAWRRRLLLVMGGGRHIGLGEITGVDAPLAGRADKAALFAATGALAVDMESHAVAEVAARRSLPFLIVRAVADPAGQHIPRWLDGIIAADGRPHLAALAGGLAAHPADLATLIRLGIASRRGLATLRRVAALGGSRFAFDA